MTADQDSEHAPPRGVAQLRRVLLRRALREWASKAQQERDDFVEELLQLFTSSASSSSSSSSASTAGTRAITRRPGVEEVRHCVLSSPSPWLPPACDVLRGEIWQVLLNVYKRNQHGAAAQEFERMMLRLSKLPRDPRLVDECAAVSELLVQDDGTSSADDRETRRLAVQNDLEILLVWFLTTKSVPYASGMARVVAVFFVLELPLPTVYDCFYQFCATFLPHFVATIDDGSHLPFSGGGGGLTKQHSLSSLSNRESSASDSASTLADDSLATEDADRAASNNSAAENSKETRRHRERQQLVEQLLSYHDPQLAHFLSQWCPSGWSEPGQYIPAGLFLDDVYNCVAPNAFVYVMDQYLLTGDSKFGVFLLVATLLDARDRLVTLNSSDAVRAALQELFASSLNDDQHMPHLCLLAARLRHRTPRSYATALVESLDSSCASRRASEIAFEMPPPGSELLRKKLDVDMSQWQKRESTSYAGKIFWYHTPTGRTQWEHPAEQFEPAPALFALPVSVNEVAPQIMGERSSSTHASSVAPPTAPSSSGSNLSMRPAEYSGDLKFFIVDCRRLRSSEDLKSGRIPAAFTLDPSVFESPELIDRTMDALNAMKSRVHIVLVGNGVGVPPELLKTDEMKTSVRDAVRHDTDTMNRAALFFQKKGFRYISCLDGGYSSWHAYVRDDPSSSPHELLNHVEDECHYCRYDTILRTGEDPLKKRQKQQAMSRRKKPGMPTTTNLLVNGGEGDASIISTYGEAPGSSSHNINSNSSGPPSSGRRSLTTSLSLTRASLSSMNMTAVRSKLSDVKMPKLSGWRRGLSFVSAPTSTGNPVNHDSSSETATADDGGSDRGSSTTDELETTAPTVVPASSEAESTEHAADSVPSPKIEEPKSFVGVFTIDYSDDEDEGLTGEEDASVPVAAPPTVSA
ncbi:hypothetical protein PINS_up005619 [Pythium insidiosum]|nr:hypothetical protein PINS_up005619 [Pythium insidiosum]